ncbi:MAG: cytochrome c-550 PedF [Pseudomonadota bacterium]
MPVCRHAALAALAICATTLTVMAAGLPLTIEPVNTDALPDVGEDWLTENPYRADKVGPEVWQTAVDIGESGYIQNCARCHGLGVVSGGLAPDLRFLEAAEYGDEWYTERFIAGYTQDGTTRMPAFGDTLGQKAAWAIRTYIETRPEDGAFDAYNDRLVEIREALGAGTGDAAAMKTELTEIAAQVVTASGAPVADSAVFRAAQQLGDTPESRKLAFDTLTIGMSAAQ